MGTRKQRRDAVDRDRSVSADELAELFELTPARIRQLVQEGILTKAARARYPLAANIRAYVRHLRTGNGAAAGGVESPKFRRERAEADRAELRVDRERDTLLPRDQALELLYDILGRLQSRIFKIPTAWSVDVVGIKSRREAVVRLRPLVATLIETLQLVAEDIEGPSGNGRR